MAQEEDKSRQRKNGPRTAKLSTIRRRTELWAGPLQGVLLVFAFLLATLSLIPASPFSVDLPTEVGQIAPYNIKSDSEFTVLDEEATLQRRKLASEAVLPIFEDNAEAVSKGAEAISGVFAEMRERLWFSPGLYSADLGSEELRRDLLDVLQPADPKAQRDTGETFEFTGADGKRQSVSLRVGASVPIQGAAEFLERERVRVVDRYGLKLRTEDFQKLAESGFSKEIENALVPEVRRLQEERGVVLSAEPLLQVSNSGWVRRNLSTGEETIVKRTDQLLTLSQASELLASRIATSFPGDEALQKAIVSVASLVLVPNLTFDEAETLLRRQKAEEGVEPVGYLVRENEMIVREGDPVTPTQLLKLDGLRSLKGGENFIFQFLGLGLLLCLIFELSYRLYIARTLPSVGDSRDSMLLLSSVFVVVLLLCRVQFALVGGLAASVPHPPWNNSASYYYSLPFCTGPMLIALIIDPHLSIIYAILFAIPAGLMLGNSLNMAIYTFVGSLVGIYGVSAYRQRSGIWRAGLLVSLTNVVVVLPMNVMNGGILSSAVFLEMLCAFIAGLLAAILISGLVPVFEWAFNLTTDFKLLELANLDHPLLRKMIVNAPGTYQHSFIVGNLAEAAAKSIDANSLLAKVGSYYHDIGKMKNPTFFIENMIGMRNKHDKIQPSLSALIITSHVREGVEMAKKYKLGQAIADIIQQHHGTTLVTFFYNKAKALEDASVSEVREADYRYDGPKPQSREAAIVMIADSCEAASRTLKTPTYPKVRDMVRKIVQAKVADGQFDECDLTFRDLHQIEKSIEKVLMAQYHTRIDYPGFVFDSRPMTDTQKVRPIR